jgi:hypothetical protein
MNKTQLSVPAWIPALAMVLAALPLHATEPSPASPAPVPTPAIEPLPVDPEAAERPTEGFR